MGRGRKRGKREEGMEGGKRRRIKKEPEGTFPVGKTFSNSSEKQFSLYSNTEDASVCVESVSGQTGFEKSCFL